MEQDLQKPRIHRVLERIPVGVLCLWAAAYCFYFTRAQGTVFAALAAVLLFCVLYWLSRRFLDHRLTIRPALRKLLWGGIIVFALVWIILGLNSSSISLWKSFLLGDQPTALWGSGRAIRSDEWAIWTPMVFSQDALGYPAVNTAINATSVDPTLVAIGGLPARNLAVVFKPFYWGFLFFGLETGYSMMSLFRFAGLLIVSYLCAQQYTKGNRPLSAAAACLIALSPYVQWWYSQSICEVLLFPQMIVLCWIMALKEKGPWRQVRWGTAAAWCFGCFVMVVYPAWQIPAAYLMLAVLVLIVIRHRKEIHIGFAARMLAPLLLSLILLFFIFRGSWDTLMNVRNSVYPGQRLYTGGNRPQNLFTGLFSLIFPFRFDIEGTNVCELSCFLSFAPAGIILAIVRRIRTKEKDPFAAILIGFVAVFGLLSLIRLPAWLTQATLLSQCTRPAFIIGLCDLLLLIRTLAQKDRGWFSARSSLLIALGCTVLSIGMMYLSIDPPKVYLFLLIPAALWSFWLIFSGVSRRLTAVTLCLLVVIGGLFVNPVQKGFSEVQELPTVSLVRSAGLDPETTVIAVEAGWPIPNSLLLAGYKVLDSTQPYADPDRWAAIDPDRKWMNVYNRLCNFSLTVSDETDLQLPKKGEANIQQLLLTVEDLKKLGVNTLLTREEYPELPLIAADDLWSLYLLE